MCWGGDHDISVYEIDGESFAVSGDMGLILDSFLMLVPKSRSKRPT